MLGLSSRSKAAIPEGGAEKPISEQIKDLRRDMENQIEGMKELSKATIETIEKIKMLNIDDICDRMNRIDARMDGFERQIDGLEKRPVISEKSAKQRIVAADSNVKPIIKLPDIPSSIAMHGGVPDENPHVIETTIDASQEKKDISETIKSYEKEKKAAAPESKGHIFSRLRGKVMPHQRKDSIFARPATDEIGGVLRDDPESIGPISNEIPEDEAPEVKASVPEAAEEPPMAPRDILEENKAEFSSPEDDKKNHAKEHKKDLLAVDKKDVKPAMDELMTSANDMIRRKKFSEATEIYLKLIDAYEKNKDDPHVEKMQGKIDDLYEKISTNLLNNLMGTDSVKKTSIFEQNSAANV